MSAELFKDCFAYYKLDETSGTTAVDSTSFHNDGQIGTSTIGQAGKINTCYSFNNQVGVACEHDAFNLTNYSDFTISWWEYRSELQDTSTSIHIPGVAIIGYSQYTSSFSIYIHSWNGGYITNLGPWVPYNTAPITNRWVHYVFSKQSNTYRFYTDGVLTNTMSASGTIAKATTCTAYIGGSPTYPKFTGKIDEVGFWGRRLSDAEIAELYNNGNGTEYTPYKYDTDVYDDCYAYYSLDETSGTTIYDSTSNHRNGTIYGTNAGALTTSGGKIENCFSALTTYNANKSIQAGFNSSVFSGLAGATISCWIRPEQYSSFSSSTFSLGGVCCGYLNYNRFNLMLSTVRPSYQDFSALYIGVGVSGQQVIQQLGGLIGAKWNHVVLTFDNGVASVYINGSKTWYSTLTKTTLATVTAPVTLMTNHTDGNNLSFLGELDEIGFWQRALTEDEINTLYNSGLGLPFESGPTYLVELTDYVGVTDDVETKASYKVDLQDIAYTTDSEDTKWDATVSFKDTVHVTDNVKVKMNYKVDVKDEVRTEDNQRIIIYKNGIDSIWTDRTKPTDTMWTNRPKPWIRN